jgi:hypothetical protein
MNHIEALRKIIGVDNMALLDDAIKQARIESLNEVRGRISTAIEAPAWAELSGLREADRIVTDLTYEIAEVAK